MMAVFYRQAPQQDTPYRQMRLYHDAESGWHVLLLGGTKWGKDHEQTLRDELVTDWDAGKEVYDRLFNELHGAGWRVYTPYENWESAPTFQKSVRW
jgi:hypothetical protein